MSSLDARAATDLDAVFGVKASIMSMQGLVAAMSMPSLEKGGFSVPLQASYLHGEAEGQMPSVGPYKAKFEGRGFGLGFATGCWADLRFFAQAMTSSIKGALDVTEASTGQKLTLQDDRTNGQAYVAGFGYRLLGDEDSTLAFGLLGGGMLFKPESHLTISNGNMQGVYSSKPTIAGPLAGAQLSLRAGNFVLNPYGFYVWDRTGCKEYEASGIGTSGCTKVDASFGAMGVNVGYKAFRLTVYSKVENDTAFDAIHMTSYSLSFTLGGD